MIETIPTSVKDLPEGSVLRLYKVTDEETEYFVQIGFVETGKHDAEGTRSKGIAFSVCTCPDGFMNLAFSLCGTRPSVCKHVDEVIAALAKEATRELSI